MWEEGISFSRSGCKIHYTLDGGLKVKARPSPLIILPVFWIVNKINTSTFPPFSFIWFRKLIALGAVFFFFFRHSLLHLIVCVCVCSVFVCLFFPFIFISWRLITLQYCSGFCLTLTWISHRFTCSPSQFPVPPPSPSHPSRSSQCTSPEHLSHASNLGWWSVSPLIVYLFQCYSLRTSHPHLLPQSLKVCSVHLCLFFCFAYRVIITIFLNSTYMR